MKGLARILFGGFTGKKYNLLFISHRTDIFHYRYFSFLYIFVPFDIVLRPQTFFSFLQYYCNYVLLQLCIIVFLFYYFIVLL